MEAKTKNEMIAKQLKNNTDRNAFFDYSVPVKEGNIWVCWYFDDLLKRQQYK